MIADLASWVTDVVQALGYPGLAVLLVLETVFPPIPSELILPLAGFLTGQGRLQFHWAVLAATAGSLAGALILYAVGATLGQNRLRWLVKRYGRWLLLREADLDQARDWFERHGGKSVLIGRCIPAVRSFISIPAGIEHMPLGKFLGYTTLGSGLFNAALIGLGWWLGAQWEQASQYTRWLEWAALLAITGTIGWFIWGRLREGDGGAGASRS